MSRPSSSALEQFFGLIFSALAVAVAIGALVRRLYKAHKADRKAREAAEHDRDSH